MSISRKRQGRFDALTVTMAVVALAAFAAIPFWLRSMTAREVTSELSSGAPFSDRVATFDGKLVFHDAQAQAEEFIGYYNSIQLTAEQEEIDASSVLPEFLRVYLLLSVQSFQNDLGPEQLRHCAVGSR